METVVKIALKSKRIDKGLEVNNLVIFIKSRMGSYCSWKLRDEQIGWSRNKKIEGT